MINVEARVLLSSINLWLKLNHTTSDLAPLVLRENFQSSWTKMVQAKMRHLGFPSEAVLAVDTNHAKTVLRQRVLNIERHCYINQCPNFLAAEDKKHAAEQATYLSLLEVPHHRRAFSLARWGVLPSASLEGHFKSIPLSEGVCPCDSGEIELTEQVLFKCAYYQGVQDKYCLLYTSPSPRD